ncbi:unnamed protein product [Closterium sp. NIES-65]|nr:unnamed protein product [Closterium sp. NIES-65]
MAWERHLLTILCVPEVRAGRVGGKQVRRPARVPPMPQGARLVLLAQASSSATLQGATPPLMHLSSPTGACFVSPSIVKTKQSPHTNPLSSTPLSHSRPYSLKKTASIVLTGDSGEVAEEFVLIPHLLLSTPASLLSPLNPSHPISQQSHCIVLTGDSREGAEDSVLIPPCLNSHFPPLSHVPSPNPFDGSYDLYTWHCNQNGVPFSNAVFTRLIAASFRRDGEDVLVLKLKQIAFYLYGVSECNVLF